MAIATLFLFADFFIVPVRAAGTFESDVVLGLGIEIGDSTADFNDGGKTIEKGRFVKYRVEIGNPGLTEYSNVTVLMETPDYMSYVAGSAKVQASTSANPDFITDPGFGMNPLELGYIIQNLAPETKYTFWIECQVEHDIGTDLVQPVAAWVSAVEPFSPAPKVGNPVENIIFGSIDIQVEVGSYPSEEAGMAPEGMITYYFGIKNIGDNDVTELSLVPNLPDHTACGSGCDFTLASLAAGTMVNYDFPVSLESDLEGVTEIVMTGFTLSYKLGGAQKTQVYPLLISHRIWEGVHGPMATGDFMLDIIQVPNIILNSADGQTARADQADLTETLYSLTYSGTKKTNTYPNLSSSGSKVHTHPYCSTYIYPNVWGATTYAYNSSGGGCDNIYNCPPVSSPIVFDVTTTLPDATPKLVFTRDGTSYSYGNSSQVNQYMSAGGTIDIPGIFTESRAVKNGSQGYVESEVKTTVSEQMYTYSNVGSEYWCTHCYSCGEDDTCCDDYTRPIYRWVGHTQGDGIDLIDTDETDITVYTATAWLKTQGGHMGTNGAFTNNMVEANRLDLGDPVVKANVYTDSQNYTPPGETNATYMIFGKSGTGEMKSEQGDAWKTTGVDFPFREKGEAYDRANVPRDFDEDMFTREKFGKVVEMPSSLSGTVELADDTVYKVDGNLSIGTKGGAPVYFSGGQARIYVTGTVQINTNIFYTNTSFAHYNEVTLLRLDAQDIVVDGNVTDIEAMLLARGTFSSGQSKKQLRILGDVIAGNTEWERQPLEESKESQEWSDNDFEINRPSEYIIEDFRKYVMPVPGDTEVPDDHTTWRQVNPATGETLDGW
ncbi:hypothetical protein JXA05_03360 [Candidatus Peregrinibacteria bacterium]|nr:hypothetical protein [Candidatus Peregrinibacteria bacterium]